MKEEKIGGNLRLEHRKGRGGVAGRGRQWVKKGAGLWLSLNWDTLRSARLI